MNQAIHYPKYIQLLQIEDLYIIQNQQYQVLYQLSKMDTTIRQPAEIVLIEGLNFQGQIKLEGNTLQLQIVQFGKGDFYTTVITNEAISDKLEDFMGFENVADLFKEIIVNREMQFTKNNSLLVCFKLVYKDKSLKMKLSLPLTSKNYENQKQKIESLLKLVESMTLQKIKYIKYLPQIMDFKGDKSNINYKHFQISNGSKVIKLLKGGQYVIYNHFDALALTGIFYYKVKIIKSINKLIFLGICAKSIVETVNPHSSPDFIGLHLKGTTGAIKLTNHNFVDGVSVFTVEINMDKKWISWYLDDILLHTTAITISLAQKSIHPMVSLHTEGDTVEFLDK